jgi:hypothetical protein
MKNNLTYIQSYRSLSNQFNHKSSFVPTSDIYSNSRTATSDSEITYNSKNNGNGSQYNKERLKTMHNDPAVVEDNRNSVSSSSSSATAGNKASMKFNTNNNNASNNAITNSSESKLQYNRLQKMYDKIVNR